MDEVKMKFCFLIPSLQSGGMERVMSELLMEFDKKKNHELHLVLYGIKRDVFYNIPQNVILHRPKFKFDNRFRIFFTLATLLYLRKKVKSLRPITVLSFGEYWNNFVLLSLIGFNLPVYVSDRCQPNKSLGMVHERLRKWLYPNAAGIIAQTTIAQNIYGTLVRNKNIKVIGNPIRHIIKKQPIIRENIILSVGRLIASKNHDRLIQIFALLNRPDWKLVIVGGDALKQSNKVKLQDQIETLGLNGRVILTGTISDVESYYSKSKIFAFTSSSEGFPNVIGEALSAGLPVVAYDCVAGPSDLITNDQNGYLINLYDDEKFKSRLIHLMDNEDLWNKLSASAPLSIARFNRGDVSNKYYSFITQHLNS